MPTESLALVSTSDESWDRRLAGVEHDFYHRRGYHQLAEWNGEGEAFLAVYERDGSRLFWPYLRRPIAGTALHDVGCVYGYPGPVSVGATAEHAAEAWGILVRTWLQQDVVSAFTCFNPLLGNVGLARGLIAAPGPSPIVTLGRSISIDLRRSRDVRLATYDRTTRREIAKSSRAGLATYVDSDGTHLDDLARLYGCSMRRANAEARYMFSRAYLDHLWDALGGRGHLLVAKVAGEVAAVLLFVVDGERAHAHLAGVSDRHVRLARLNVLLDSTAEAARLMGARLLHLGAGRGGREDSLYRFKRRIGDVEHAFDVGRWVLDPSAYAELCGDVVAKSEPAFFPAYRASAAR